MGLKVTGYRGTNKLNMKLKLKRSVLYMLRDYKIFRSAGHSVAASVMLTIQWAWLDYQ